MKIAVALIVAIPVLTGVYFYYPSSSAEIDLIFLTITTFVFATISGFFISQQTTRYGKLLSELATYDGRVHYIYRMAMTLDKEFGEKIAHIIIDGYKDLVARKQWENTLEEEKKNYFLSDLNNVIHDYFKRDSVSNFERSVTTQFFNSLSDLQAIRKTMILLKQERVGRVNWILTMLLAILLVTMVSFLPAAGVLTAFIKASFVVAVLFVVFVLYRLDNSLGANSDDVIGQASAEDLLKYVEDEHPNLVS